MSTKTHDEVKAELKRKGMSIASWAKRHQVSAALTQEILAGRRKAIRGESHVIAVLLKLKDGEIPESHPAARHAA